jgi:hypothetical protein
MKPIHCRAILLPALLGISALTTAALAQALAEKSPAAPGKTAARAAVSVRGTLVSDLMVEVRWQSALAPSASATIVKIAPEGSAVKQGDVLVEFACDELANQRLEAEIQALKDDAALISAKNQVEVAKIGLVEYQEGLFPIQQHTLF